MPLELDHGGVPTEDQMIAALAKAFDAPEAAAITWLAAIHIRFDAKAAQERLVEREGMQPATDHTAWLSLSHPVLARIDA